jgi:hypothetical protein
MSLFSLPVLPAVLLCYNTTAFHFFQHSIIPSLAALQGKLALPTAQTVGGSTLAIAAFAIATGQLLPLVMNPSTAPIQWWWKLRSNILAGSIIFTLGDLAAQLLTAVVATRKTMATTKANFQSSFQFRLNQQRLAISTVLGVLWAGMTNPAVYAMVERTLPGGGPADVGRILSKMAMSISILSTAGNYGTMFFRRFAQQICDYVVDKRNSKNGGGRNLLQRFQSCFHSCNRDFPEVFADDLKVWPLYDIMVFSVVPPPLRPISNAIMASLWSMYMSIASAKQVVEVVEDSDSDTDSDTPEGIVVPVIDTWEAKAKAEAAVSQHMFTRDVTANLVHTDLGSELFPASIANHTNCTYTEVSMEPAVLI